jgi:cytochrome P450
VTTLSPPVVYDPYSAAFKADPWPVYRQLRDTAPVYVSERWGFYALSRFDDVRAAVRDHETYLSFEGIDIDDTAKDMSAPGFLPDIDNPRHDQLRRIVQRTFLPRAIAKLEDDVRRVVTGLVDRFADAGEADIAQDLSWPIPCAVFFDVLGLPTTGSNREDLVRWSHGLKDRENDDPRPDQRAALLADPSRIPAAVEEALRFDAPLQVAGRTTTREVELHGVSIPAGRRVFLVYGSANRDERQYEDPDRFDVWRQQKRHMSFSEGLHGCLGAPLARLEARVALEVALPRLGDYVISGPMQQYRSTPNMRVLDHLPISFTPAGRNS